MRTTSSTSPASSRRPCRGRWRRRPENPAPGRERLKSAPGGRDGATRRSSCRIHPLSRAWRSTMKKLAAAFVVLSLAALPAAIACDKEHGTATQSAECGKGPVKDVVLTGFLTDSNCGKANAREGGA